MATTESHVTNR